MFAPITFRMVNGKKTAYLDNDVIMKCSKTPPYNNPLGNNE